ncbi:unnamed protein product [Larinioides sclopetarius]|uniref:Uncharacterized protein n=1 Tax=Larinioides sclopetarius TaxID=280406 RepID=A0AAV1Z9A1_9ARAC
MSSDPKLSKSKHDAQEISNSAESKEPASEKKNLFCDLCKISVSSEKNLEVHENGKKHQKTLNKIKEKESRKSLKTSNSSDKLTEKMDTNDNHSPIAPSDLQYSSSSESNRDTSHRKKSHSRDYRNNYSKPISPSDNYYSPNRREPYYNNRNYDNRNHYRNRWSSNQPFRNDPNKRFHSFNHYNRYDQNYEYNHSQWMGDRNLPIFDNWADISNLEGSNFFSENIQSENIQPENIQPVECTNYETHSNNKNFDELKKSSTDEQISPSRRSVKVVVDKKTKRSPRIQIKVIPKTPTTPESSPQLSDVQNQSGSEKQQEKSIVLSENMTGKRLAHWINPSNQKDQAEIRRLVTEFSKSKKKENLIKLKLHTDKVTVNKHSNQSAVEETNNLSSLPTTPEIPESGSSAHLSSETVVDIFSNSLAVNSVESNERQRSNSFTEIPTSTNSPVMPLPSARNRSESLTLEENAKKPRRRYTKRTASNPCESPSRKRKESVELGSCSKKHKCSSAECLEKCIESAIANADALIQAERTESVETTSLAENATNKDLTSQKESVYIKKEIFDEMDSTEMTSLSLDELIQKQTDVISSCQDDASMTPVESLINLFATGNITIKKEFDDPLIDAIRSIDPVLLNKVCEDQPDKNSSSQATVEKAVEPVINPPAAIPDNSPAPLNNSPSLTLSLKNILNELQIISEEEEKVKDSLLKADQQIQYYQSVLDEWKTKKIKFQSEEEILRNKRNTLVRTMNDLVEQQSLESRSTTESPVPEEKLPSNSSLSTNEIKNMISSVAKEVNTVESNHIENDSSTVQQDITTEKTVKSENEVDVITVEGDDVVILPLPESRIPVIDLDHVGSPGKNNATDASSKKNSNAESIAANCHKIRDLVAHNAVINSIQIFDDYLYTCANDKMARRFSLKDPNEVVTYRHAEKNIFHLFVEKMRGKTYVFTAGFNSNLVTVFDAESAHKVKVYQFRPNIAGMCKSRYKIYVGLRNGSIVACDWKEQKDLVDIEEPIRSIASTHQGGINILVTLSTKGHVSVRDADRNGLLIKYVKALNHVPLFMSIYNDWVYLSSAGYLSVLDLSSGNFVKKYELPAAYTSLTVYKDHIFTTSFSGFVRCYSKYDIQDVKAYYGAGKMALTCIHAHDSWIFTGNRTGEVSVFKFDPEKSLPCQFGKCQMVFARIDDLMYHVLQGKDHNLISMRTCLWRKCNAPIKRSWDQEAIHNHIRAHIKASFPYLHEPMYNLSV